MSDVKTVQQVLVNEIRQTGVFNPNIQAGPVCILWPDKDRQWETVIPTLQAAMPELFVLGKYLPENRTGPAIWLKCVIANTLEDIMNRGQSRINMKKFSNLFVPISYV